MEMSGDLQHDPVVKMCTLLTVVVIDLQEGPSMIVERRCSVCAYVNEIAQLEVASQTRCLGGDTFHETAIASED